MLSSWSKFSSLLVLLLLPYSYGADTTWQKLCNGKTNSVRVSPGQSFMYPSANATVVLPLAKDCKIQFVPINWVAMRIIVQGDYSNNSITISTGGVAPISTTIHDLNTYEVPITGQVINVNINSKTAAAGPLTFSIEGIEAGITANTINLQPKESMSHYVSTNSTEYKIVAPKKYKLLFFFCFPKTTSILQSANALFYDAFGGYLTNAAQFIGSGKPYMAKPATVNLFLHPYTDFIGQVVSYTYNTNADWSKYTSSDWSGTSMMKNEAVVVGRSSISAADEIGKIDIIWGDQGTQLWIYDGVAEMTSKGVSSGNLIVSANGSQPIPSIYVDQSVVTIIVTKGGAAITFSMVKNSETTMMPDTTKQSIHSESTVGHQATTIQNSPELTTSVSSHHVTTAVDSKTTSINAEISTNHPKNLLTTTINGNADKTTTLKHMGSTVVIHPEITTQYHQSTIVNRNPTTTMQHFPPVTTTIAKHSTTAAVLTTTASNRPTSTVKHVPDTTVIHPEITTQLAHHETTTMIHLETTTTPKNVATTSFSTIVPTQPKTTENIPEMTTTMPVHVITSEAHITDAHSTTPVASTIMAAHVTSTKVPVITDSLLTTTASPVHVVTHMSSSIEPMTETMHTTTQSIPVTTSSTSTVSTRSSMIIAIVLTMLLR